MRCAQARHASLAVQRSPRCVRRTLGVPAAHRPPARSSAVTSRLAKTRCRGAHRSSCAVLLSVAVGAGYLPAWIEPRAVHRVVQAPPTRAGLRRFGTSSTTLMLRRAPRRPPLPIPTSTVGWAHMRTERDALAHAASGMQRRDAHVRMAERHRAGSPVRALLHEQSDQPCCGSCVLEPTHPTRDCLTRRIAIGQVRPSPPLCIDPASVSAAAVGAESAGQSAIRLIRLGEWLTRTC